MSNIKKEQVLLDTNFWCPSCGSKSLSLQDSVARFPEHPHTMNHPKQSIIHLRNPRPEPGILKEKYGVEVRLGLSCGDCGDSFSLEGITKVVRAKGSE